VREPELVQVPERALELVPVQALAQGLVRALATELELVRVRE
jgi:hypothetical protein